MGKGVFVRGNVMHVSHAYDVVHFFVLGEWNVGWIGDDVEKRLSLGGGHLWSLVLEPEDRGVATYSVKMSCTIYMWEVGRFHGRLEGT